MRKFNASTLALVAMAALFTACDQRPIDLGPESTGMEWSRVVEFDTESNYDRPDVWASSPYDVYGWSRFTTPRFQHFDGTAWTPVSFQPNSNYYIDICGSGPSDVYVTDGTVHHFDGVSWTDTGIQAGLISGSSASNVFVSSDSLVLRFNGAAWDTLMHKVPSRQIRDIAAYGTNGAFFAARDSLLQWENNQWKAYAAPGLADRVVTTDGTSCVLASYDNGTTNFWSFNQGVWNAVADPLNSFVDDMCLASGTVWVAHGGRLLRFDGDSWVPATVPTHSGLSAVWGTSTSFDIYSAGDSGVTLHSPDDVHWDVIRSGLPSDAYSLLAETPSDFLIGSNYGSIYRYLDGVWSEQVLPGERFRVTALAGSGTGSRFAGTSSGNVYQYDGANWTLSADSLDSSFVGVIDLAATSDGAAYAAGIRFISEFDGNEWKRIYSGEVHFQYVWGVNKSIAFATAYEGVYQFDGHTWKRVLANEHDRYAGIWGTAADDVYVAGGSIYHFDGHTWKNVFPSNSFELIAGTGADDVVAYSQLGMARFDGSIWRWSYSNGNGQPIDLAPTSDGHMLRMYAQYLVSERGPIIVVSQRVAP